MDKKNTTQNISQLLDIMEQLRHPEKGCPWDIEQNFKTIAPYTIEEAYEVAAAIDEMDMEGLKGELGDLLFQVVFLSQLAQEEGYFTFEDVVQRVADKMTRRHPHVFGNATIEDADAQITAWEQQKHQERQQKAKDEGKTPSLLDDVPACLPALLRAIKLQNRAARVGFDWPNTSEVIDKMKEEIIELGEAIANQKDTSTSTEHIEEEFGDLMFVCANLGRHLNLDPEEALRKANVKFIKRFKYVEGASLRANKKLENCSLEEMEAYWEEAKQAEKP
jgi:MazG family protein